MSSPLNLTTGLNRIKYRNDKNGSYISIFNKNKFYYRPSGMTKSDILQNTKPHRGSAINIYDISTSSIIDYTNQYPAMRLKPSDFAYLKNIGVFPNNRLIIARRFKSTTVPNDLTSVKTGKQRRKDGSYFLPTRDSGYDSNIEPVSTLISWIPDNEDFLNFSFGESWEPASETIADLLNSMLNQFTRKNDVDVNGGGGVLPLPGFTAGLQFEILKLLGYTNLDSNSLPSGSPNIIHKSMRRSTADGKIGGFSGLDYSVSIKMIVEYEQKFINGVDPTIVFLDILNNVLRFGTSKSQFLASADFANSNGKIMDFFRYFKDGNWDEAAKVILDEVIRATAIIGQKLLQGISGISDSIKSSINDSTQQDSKSQKMEDKNNQSVKIALNVVKEIASKIGSGIISQYRTRISSVLSAMTGDPSTPWHVTIGNPKKPIFSSGDMFCEDINFSLGSVLAFNDLPSTIKIELTLKNSRPLGLQEIFDRLNVGSGRSYISGADVLFEGYDNGFTSGISSVGGTSSKK
jgi:hypothetical protein